MRADFLEKLVDLSKNLVLWLNHEPPYYQMSRKYIVDFLKSNWPPVDKDEEKFMEDLETCLGFIDLVTHKFQDALCTFIYLSKKSPASINYYYFLAEAYFQLDYLQHAWQCILTAESIGGTNQSIYLFAKKIKMTFNTPDIKSSYPINISFFHDAIMKKLQFIINLIPTAVYPFESLNASILILIDYIKCLKEIRINTLELAKSNPQLANTFLKETFSYNLDNEIIYHEALLNEYKMSLTMLAQKNRELRSQNTNYHVGTTQDILIRKKIEDAIFSSQHFKHNLKNSYIKAEEVLTQVKAALNPQQIIDTFYQQYTNSNDVTFEQMVQPLEALDEKFEDNTLDIMLRDLTSPLDEISGSDSEEQSNICEPPLSQFFRPIPPTIQIFCTDQVQKPKTNKPLPTIQPNTIRLT